MTLRNKGLPFEPNLDIQAHLLIVGTGSLFSCFLLALRSSPKKDVVDQSIFQKGHENKDKAPHRYMSMAALRKGS